MRLIRLLLLCSAVLLAAPAAAQPEPSDAQMGLARRLIDLLDVQQASALGVRMAMENQIAVNPQMAFAQPIIEKWASEIFSSEEAAEGFARIYAETFTEAELREMVAFYSSPIGRRMVAEQTNLANRAAEMGRELAEDNLGALMERLQEAAP